MEQKHKSAAILLVLGGIILLSLGITYAYFAARITGDESASTLNFDAGKLTIEFSDVTSSIAMSNVFPKTDPWATKVFTLTGTNSIEKKMNYQIVLSTSQNNFPDNYIACKLTGDNVSNNGVVANTDYVYINGTGNLALGYGQFAANSTDAVHRYTLDIYFLDNGRKQNDGQNKGYKGKVYIKEAGIGDHPVESPSGWTDAPYGTLLAGIQEVHPEINTHCSEAGRAIAETNEGLCSAQDDYGVSYYFRGFQENNYVKFAGMCWRIVRVDGRGNTKLVLYNNGTGNTNTDNPCAAENNGTEKAFSSVAVPFNNPFNKNAYVGFMYGSPDSSDYVEEHTNSTKSNVLNSLISFYNNKLNNYDDILADVVWCNDKSINEGRGTGVGTDETYYAGYDRLNTPAAATPTFRCLDSNGSTTEGRNLSRFTTGLGVDNRGNRALNFNLNNTNRGYKIGLLTADEVAYAGAIMSTNNNSYYLYQNASSTKITWTMTPYRFGNNIPCVFSIIEGGKLSFTSVIGTGPGNAYTGVRPSIALVPSTTYTVASEENMGSFDNPFIIGE